MPRFPEAGRQVAHVLIDGVSAADHDNIDIGSAAADLAYQRISDIPDGLPVNVTDTDDNTHIAIDLSNVLGASMITIDWLIKQLADSSGHSIDEIIVALREYVDG